MPQTRREAVRRRARLADLAVHWENRRRLCAIQPAVEAQRRAGAAACIAATKAAAAAAYGKNKKNTKKSSGKKMNDDIVRPFSFSLEDDDAEEDLDDDEEEYEEYDVKDDALAAAAGGVGGLPGRPRGVIPDSALRALESAAEGFAWVGAWVEANPDLQGLAAWVPTPAQVAADRAKVERARLQCLCGLVEHFADAAAEAVRWQRFDDATRLSRATEALDKAASAASAARAAATEARRALDASISTLPADDAVRLSCSRRVALAGASAVETTADIAAARVRFDFQVGAANTMSKSRAVLEVSAASLEATLGG